MKASEQNHHLLQSLILAPDARQTVLAELGQGGLNRLAYTPYGSRCGQQLVATALGFNGELRERPLGWYHLGNGHRVFNPILMRFHSPDRLSPFDEGGFNPYAYCVGDPINYVDPTGQVPSWLQPLLTIGLHIGIIAATVITAINAPPVGLALWAARISLIGSPIAITGSALQLGGVEEGRIVSAVGTTFSIGAVATRTGVGVKTLLSKSDSWKTFRNGVLNLARRPERPRGNPLGGNIPVRRSIVQRSSSQIPPAQQTLEMPERNVWVTEGAVRYRDLDGELRTFRSWV
jgi:RHS repeat-associated protein